MTKTFTAILLASFCLFYSCKQSEQKATAVPNVDTAHITAKVAKKDTDTVAVQHPKYLVNVEALYLKSRRTCPATIRKCSVVTDISGSRAIIVNLQNTTDKKIGAVKVWWIVYNKSGKMVGNSNGMAKKALARGKSASYSWAINANKNSTAKAFVYIIRYGDGSSWKVD